jgi:TolB-like protein/Flp pilus assembly protein TadD
MSFFSELKRRNVYRVAALYVIVSWAVLQFVEVSTEFIALPEWTGRLVLVLLMAGFPVSLVLAWAIELTPEGIRLETPGEGWSPSRRRRGDRIILAGLGLILLLGAWRLIGVWTDDGGEAVEIHSLVVLPLDNLMEDPGQAYFVEGMHEAIITELSRIPGLRVISRTSAMKYRDSAMSVPEIGEELGVDAVVEGSVLRSGETVRVTAQMIEAASDRHIWADNFDRNLTDILALYADVTREIANRIRLEVSPEQAVALDAPSSVDTDGYDDYLRGSYLCEKWGPQEMREGIGLMRRAVAADPDYALAHAGLAICLQYASFFDYLEPTGVISEARAAADRAIELDRNLPEAWVAFAAVRYYLGFDLPASELALERALSLNPSHVRALTHLSWQLGEDGRTDEAVALARQAMALDPFSASTGTTLAQAYLLGRDFEAALPAWRDLVELDPADPSLRYYLGWSLEAVGDYAQAIASHQSAVELSGRESLYLSGLGHALAVSGRTAEATALLTELELREVEGRAEPIHLAMVHLGLGSRDRAMEELERAYESRNSHMLYLKHGPQFDPLRGDERFEALLTRMGW